VFEAGAPTDANSELELKDSGNFGKVHYREGEGLHLLLCFVLLFLHVSPLCCVLQ